MNNLVAVTGSLSMTSKEIAELTGKRHDNVKRTIETLSEQGVIRRPQIEVFEELNNLDLPVKRQVYVFSGQQGKRDIVVVAGYNLKWSLAHLRSLLPKDWPVVV